MKKVSKRTRQKISSLSTILSYICVDLLSDEKFLKLRELDAHQFSKIIEIAYEPHFTVINDVNKIAFKRIVKETLEEMTDEEISLVFDEIYLPFEDAENPEFVRELLFALKNKYEWLE